MIIKRALDIRSSEITDENLYLRRREFMKAAAVPAVAALAGLTPAVALAAGQDSASQRPEGRRHPRRSPDAVGRRDDVQQLLRVRHGQERPRAQREELPHEAVDGEGRRAGQQAGRLPFDDLVTPHALEERVYRLRCVEAWSMVIPWVGFPLKDLLKRVEPQGGAKFVEFTTLNDPKQMPGQRVGVLDWPYVEGLRLDEAMHPLTILAVGLYGKVLPNQNGAPLRLVVPWKYGFKSIKSIVGIRFTAKQPVSSWQASAPQEYGFYSNVNPDVDHPRWSQASERRIGEFLKRKTLMFNGYADQVAGLYAGMDLKKFY